MDVVDVLADQMPLGSTGQTWHSYNASYLPSGELQSPPVYWL